MYAARAKKIYERQAKERMLAGKADPTANLPEGKGDARDAAGKAFGVSGKSVDHATNRSLRIRCVQLSRWTCN